MSRIHSCNQYEYYCTIMGTFRTFCWYHICAGCANRAHGLCSFHISWPQLSWFYCRNCLYQFSFNCTEITFNFFFFFFNLHNTKHENNTAATNMWSSDYISQKTDNQVLGNKNSEHTNQREALISEGIIKTETILQHICGHSIATSGYLRYEFTGLSRFLKIRLSRKPKLF